MESKTEISEIQQNLIKVFKKHLADYLKLHKKDYFKTLSDKSADNIIKNLIQLTIFTSFFGRDPGMERARVLAKEITGKHDNARHLIVNICHKYLNKDDAKGMINSQNLR